VIYRRFIRIGSKLIASPEFSRKRDAEHWYFEMRKKKHFERYGLTAAPGESGLKFIDYCRDWMNEREKNYPRATVDSDDQRLRDYVLPFLAEYPLERITRDHVKSVLNKISRAGFRKAGKSISTGTRTRVQALMSAIFTSAMNETPPLIANNPAHGIQFKEKRKGKKKPLVLESKDACIQFLKAAQEVGQREFAVCSTVLMSGLRKQELIALRWRCTTYPGYLDISEKYEQASNSIKPGTKGGENVTRRIPIPSELVLVLVDWRAQSSFPLDNDFVFCTRSGRHLNARVVSAIVERVRTRAGLRITMHGLRHTYGREFALNTGNVKALQAILGHSSSATTDIYSELAGERLKGFKESVTYGVNRRQD
jgi:integrase